MSGCFDDSCCGSGGGGGGGGVGISGCNNFHSSHSSCPPGDAMVRKHELLAGMAEVSTIMAQLDSTADAHAPKPRGKVNDQVSLVATSIEGADDGDDAAGDGIDAIAAAFVAFGVRPIEHLVLEVIVVAAIPLLIDAACCCAC